MKLGPHTELLGNFQPLFFPLDPALFFIIFLLGNLDVCEQTVPLLGKSLSWVTHKASAGPCMPTGAQHRPGKVLSQQCPAQGHKGPPPASPRQVPQPAVQLGGFACCSHAVHPHVHAFTFPPASASAKLQRQPVNLHHVRLPQMVYLYQTGKHGYPGVQGNRGYFCLEWLLSQGRKAGGIQEEQLHVKG